MTTRNAPPRAGALLQALRGLGYSTASALADIIDNSISAGATEIRIRFDWCGEYGEASRIAILDNGRGMSDAELERAMTLGDKSPLDARAANDLGRFGMGLKTASFSQCRQLTVASRKANDSVCCLRWDLDALSSGEYPGWALFEGAAEGSEAFLSPLTTVESGTLVLWEKLDRIVTPGSSLDHFADMIDGVEQWLAMIFHRLIASPNPHFRLFINEKPVRPWDPFMMGHPAKCWQSPPVSRTTPGGLIEMQCHVLPHKDRLSEAEFNLAAGPEGWTAQQGFYIYRNQRLLLAGGWLGLGRAWNRDESHRLARIRLDIGNSADAEWKIDIRKSTARPPVTVRPWLTRLAEDTRERARQVFAFRGTPAPRTGNGVIEQAWRIEHLRNGIRYRIDPGHPAVAAVLDVAGEQTALIRAMLRVIEETVPVQRIWLDTAENRDPPRTGFSGQGESAESSHEVREILLTLYRDMTRRRGMSPEAALRILAATDPFQHYPALVASLPEADSIRGE